MGADRECVQRAIPGSSIPVGMQNLVNRIKERKDRRG
jgi:hypothetical protein